MGLRPALIFPRLQTPVEPNAAASHLRDPKAKASTGQANAGERCVTAVRRKGTRANPKKGGVGISFGEPIQVTVRKDFVFS